MNRQRRGIILGMVVAAFLAGPGAVSAEEGASGASETEEIYSAQVLTERVQHFYRQTEDFQAAFIQRYTDIAAGETMRSRGRVYFKKPGMMRWDYYDARDDNRRDRVLVSDGSMFWIYEFEYQQVFRQCLEDSQLPTTLRFLMGEGDLAEEFDVELAENSTRRRPVLELTPKEPTSHYRMLRFVLDPQTYQVVQTTVYDPYGNTNQIEFHNTRVNRNIQASSFQFTVPEGARELNPNKRCD